MVCEPERVLQDCDDYVKFNRITMLHALTKKYLLIEKRKSDGN